MTPEPTLHIEPARNRWRAFFAGHVIADTGDALILSETGHPPVVYFPRDDVEMTYFSRTDRHSHCPLKGEAGYFTLLMDGEWAESSAWTYEAPRPGCEALAGRIAFDPEKIEVYEVDDAQVNPHHETRTFQTSEVDQTIQHTDSGSGASQRDHWTPNVEGPGPDGGLR